MKKLIVVLVVALAIPTSVAFAKPPATHTSHGKAAPMVMYVVKGTLSNYVAATSPTSDGSISITVTHSNFHARALVGQPFSLAVASTTRVTNRNGTAQTAIAPGSKIVLKFKAPLHFAAGTDLATTIPTMAKALHVIVQRNG